MIDTQGRQMRGTMRTRGPGVDEGKWDFHLSRRRQTASGVRKEAGRNASSASCAGGETCRERGSLEAVKMRYWS